MTHGTDDLLVWLKQANPRVDIVGGKGASLARLTAFGSPTPPAVCLTTNAHREAMRGFELHSLDPGDIRRQIGQMPLSQRLTAAIWATYAAVADRVGRDVPLAVRSSAPAEDSDAHSFAGLHDTVLDVRDLATLEAAVKQCWASLWTERAVAYRRSGTITDDPAIAVVIQQMVHTDVALVAFTADPISGDRDRLVINATYGLGEALVSGIVTPDQIVVDQAGQILDYRVGEKAQMVIPGMGGTRTVDVPRALRRLPVLTDTQVELVARTARDLADRLGFPADVEAGFAGGDLVLFQARPITTLQPADAGGWLVSAA